MQEDKESFRRELIEEALDLLADLEDLDPYEFSTMSIEDILGLLETLRLRRVVRKLDELRGIGWPRYQNGDQKKTGGAVPLDHPSRKTRY